MGVEILPTSKKKLVPRDRPSVCFAMAIKAMDGARCLRLALDSNVSTFCGAPIAMVVWFWRIASERRLLIVHPEIGSRTCERQPRNGAVLR
jgi:hypothetical protein